MCETMHGIEYLPPKVYWNNGTKPPEDTSITLKPGEKRSSLATLTRGVLACDVDD
jgi:hypothetical protein